MDIVADFGNTFVKAGVVDNGSVVNVTRFETQNLNPGEFSLYLNNIKPERICFLSVTDVCEEIIRLMDKHAGFVYRFTNASHLPFPVNYKSRETLGLDRLAGVVGAYSLYPGKDLLVIQAGTCITYDFYLIEKGYCGGAISPGTNIRNRAMNTFTHQLPLINEDEIESPEIIGKSTSDSLKSGIFNGALFEMEGFIDYAFSLSENLIVVISGGNMAYFVRKIKKNQIFANSNLTLIGLTEILKINE